MWFKYIVVVVFAIEAIMNFLASRGKTYKETPTGLMMASVLYIVLAVLTIVLIK